MQDYLTTGIARFGVGRRLRLTAAQIAPRRPMLHVADAKKGVVVVEQSVEFKAGERLGVDGDLARFEQEILEPLGKVKAEGVEA
jgi:hypothetical protein